LNFNISAFRQSIKNLVESFGAIYVGNMHTNFQPSSFTGVERAQGDISTRGVTPEPYPKFLNFPHRFSLG